MGLIALCRDSCSLLCSSWALLVAEVVRTAEAAEAVVVAAVAVVAVVAEHRQRRLQTLRLRQFLPARLTSAGYHRPVR